MMASNTTDKTIGVLVITSKIIIVRRLIVRVVPVHLQFEAGDDAVVRLVVVSSGAVVDRWFGVNLIIRALISQFGRAIRKNILSKRPDIMATRVLRIALKYAFLALKVLL